LPRVSRCGICERMTTKCTSTGHLHVTRSSVSAVSISSTASAQPERPGFGPPMDPLPLSVNSMPLEAVNVHGNRALRSSSRSISTRSEEHTSELQSRFDLVCRLLLEKKKKKI